MTGETDQVLLIDKPYRWTSFDVVNKLRHLTGIRKIGHAGTLDPLATGLLIVCTGKRTREISLFQDLEKEYTGVFVVGKTTASHDLETEVIEVTDPMSLTQEQIESAARQFVGSISQIPPAHSAIKVAGKRSYSLARKGKAIQLDPRTVHIREFEITRIALPEIHFRVVCSKGTYIRSLARDFGQALGTGAYLSQLCRTRIGPHRLTDAVLLNELEKRYTRTGTQE